MDIIPAEFRQYIGPAVLSVLAVGLLKMGIFVTVGDLERSLRVLEAAIRTEYATKQDVQDIKLMLGRVTEQLDRLDERLRKPEHP